MEHQADPPGVSRVRRVATVDNALAPTIYLGCSAMPKRQTARAVAHLQYAGAERAEEGDAAELDKAKPGDAQAATVKVTVQILVTNLP